MMHLAPSLPPSTRRVEPAATRFLRLLYGDHEGYIELAWIDGDPDDRQRHVFGRTWFAYTPERLPELYGRINDLCRRYGNVYVSVYVYAQPRRNAPIEPGRVIVVDDLPPDVACSFSVQTSPQSRHGYFLLDHKAPAEVLRDLARRAAYTLGGDRGGWDSQQLVRVPGTFNTKARHGGRFAVALRAGNQRRYSVEELRTIWPVVETATTADPDLGWPEVEHWLGNLDVLIGESGLPRRVKPTTQTGRVLREGLDDTSLARYIVAKGLAMHGYPDAEIAALLWHYCDYGKLGEKGTPWLKADIQRIIGKVRAELSQVVPSPTRVRNAQPAVPLPEAKTPKRGRKTTLTPDALLAWYEEQRSCGDVVLLTVGEVAQQLGVSRATVERCERVLREQGMIERRCFAHRQTSLVELRRPLTNATTITPALPAQNAASPSLAIPELIPEVNPYLQSDTEADGSDDDSCPLINAADTPVSTSVHVPSTDLALSQQDAKETEMAEHGGTHPPAGPPRPTAPALPAGRPSPRAAVAEAFDHFAGRPRITRQMLTMFLDSKYPELEIAASLLDCLIADERARRAWKQQLDGLRGLPQAKLKRLGRKIDRLLTEGPDGPNGQQYRWACAISAHVNAELERREAILDRVDPERIRRRHNEYLALADQARRQERVEDVSQPKRALPPQAGTSGGLCSSHRAEQGVLGL